MRILITILFVSAFFIDIANAQTFHLKNFRVEHGMPSSQVYDIAQDSNGTLYIATDLVLTTYDGSSFKTYSKVHGLADNSISKLFVSASGEEVTAFNVQSGKKVWSSDAMRSDVIVVDVVLFTNYIVTATSRGVIQLRDYQTGEVVKTAQSKGGGLRDLSVMPDGERLLLTTRDGAVHVWENKMIHVAS